MKLRGSCSFSIPSNSESPLNVVFVPIAKCPSVEVHFSVELPAFPMQTMPFGRRRAHMELNRSVDHDAIAAEMAELNSGHFSVEVVDPRNTYAAFLRDLLFITGVASIFHMARYRLDVEVGVCFDAEPVCTRVAECVRHHFYPDSKCSIESRLRVSLSEKGRDHVHV